MAGRADIAAPLLVATLLVIHACGCRGGGRAPPAGNGQSTSTDEAASGAGTAPATPTATGPATAPSSGDSLSSVRTLFNRAVGGDSRALRRCQELLRAADAEPVKVLAYRGACRVLEAADAPLPWDKGRLAREGLTMLDEAAKRSPGDVEVRFLRGMTNYNLPRFFGRGDVVAADLAAVAGEAEEAVRDGRIDETVGAAALYHHGVLLERRGDRAGASIAWRRATLLGPDTRGGRAASQKLGTAAGR